MPKKDFSNLERMTAPVDKFLPKTEPQAEPPEAPAIEEPPAQKFGSKYVAAVDPYQGPRSRRVQLLMRPGLFAALKHIAARKKKSINNLIEENLLEFVERERREEEKQKKG